MKLPLIITKLLLFPYIICAQGLISTQLSEEIEKTDKNSFISITIEINEINRFTGLK